MSADLTHYMQATSRLREQVATLTAEVERLRAQEGWQRSLFDQAVAQRNEAVALLREARYEPQSYDWKRRRDALLAAVAPQEADDAPLVSRARYAASLAPPPSAPQEAQEDGSRAVHDAYWPVEAQEVGE